MTILYILDPATIGGATKSIMGLLKEMRGKGVIPIVCVAHDVQLYESLKNDGITAILTGHQEMISYRYSGGIKAIWYNFRKLLRYVYHDYKAISIILKSIRLINIDLIHTNSSRSDIGFYLAKKLNKPHVVHLREFGDIDYDCHPQNPFYISTYNKYANKFICVSDAVRKHWISKGICETKTITIYNGIDYSLIKASDDESKNKENLRIVMSGAIYETKGQHIAIKALSMLPEHVKHHVELNLIGWWDFTYKRKLEELINKERLTDQVVFWGAKDNVLQLLEDFQVGLMCSRSEGFGRVTAEFMHAKLGVIASDSGANPELIEDGVTGLLFRSGDAKSLSNAIYKFYINRDLLIDCSNAAYKKAREQFTAKKNANDIYSIYTEVLNSSHESK